MQGTVARFPGDGSGEVVLDDGTRLPFDAAAFAVSGLRSLRPGQRVRLRVDAGGRVTGLTLLTLTWADAPAGSDPPTGSAPTAGRA